MIEFEFSSLSSPMVKIKVIGVGGAGGNTIESMINANLQNIDFIVANTDAQALNLSRADTKIQLGQKSTKGLGAGANPEVGKRAAEEDLEKIIESAGDADIVFLTAGMGGGTGSGATHVIAKSLREKGILTIAVVTKPFVFEGNRRARIAQDAIDELRGFVDTLIVIPNQKLLEVVNKNVSMLDAFSIINEVLANSVKGIADIIAKPGHINVDFADLRVIMKDKGIAIMGTGKAAGENRARQAALNSINSPLLENMDIKGAKSVLINISGSSDMGIFEINEAASVIYEQADPDANIILGAVIDDSLEKEVCVTLIATGFSSEKEEIAYKSPKIETQEKVEQAILKQSNSNLNKPNKSEIAVLKEVVMLSDHVENELDVPTFLRKQQMQEK